MGRKHSSFILVIILIWGLASCSKRETLQTPDPAPTAGAVTATPRPTITQRPSPSPSSVPTGTASPTATPIPTPTATIPPEPVVFDWAGYSPLLFNGVPINCPTPKSLMLHIAYGAARMEQLAQEIIERELITITYQDIIGGLLEGKCPAKNTIVVSLDDLGSVWLQPEFPKMVQVFLDHNLKMVVGVVVKGPQASFVWDYFREIDAKGIEIASHSVNHYNLNELDNEVQLAEIKDSFAVICEYLGKCPVSFILPYGAYDQRVVITSVDYTFIVGIGGGTIFDGDPPFYVGRLGPDVYDQASTIQRLEWTFDVNYPTPTQSQTSPHPIRTPPPKD